MERSDGNSAMRDRLRPSLRLLRLLGLAPCGGGGRPCARAAWIVLAAAAVGGYAFVAARWWPAAAHWGQIAFSLELHAAAVLLLLAYCRGLGAPAVGLCEAMLPNGAAGGKKRTTLCPSGTILAAVQLLVFCAGSWRVPVLWYYMNPFSTILRALNNGSADHQLVNELVGNSVLFAGTFAYIAVAGESALIVAACLLLGRMLEDVTDRLGQAARVGRLTAETAAALCKEHVALCVNVKSVNGYTSLVFGEMCFNIAFGLGYFFTNYLSRFAGNTYFDFSNASFAAYALYCAGILSVIVRTNQKVHAFKYRLIRASPMPSDGAAAVNKVIGDYLQRVSANDFSVTFCDVTVGRPLLLTITSTVFTNAVLLTKLHGVFARADPQCDCALNANGSWANR